VYFFFPSLHAVSASLSYFTASAFPSLHENFHNLKFTGYDGNLRLVLGDWAVKDTEDSSQKYFLLEQFNMVYFNRVQKLTRNLIFSAFR